AVMYAGYLVEIAPVDALYKQPDHPYTNALLKSIPRVDSRDKKRLATIHGVPPDLRQEFHACPFSPRCPNVMDKCKAGNPPLFS
ncbi:peptide ABC transporter ATP-binding protein, partial [candidate division KSB1 bacterium]|nr:peptide ABC transporter ATP-binding protein [Phycisphaerae bacterium]NIR52935.1 peptide ABC transporter ATP-binding protein [candidate division KSB1 bacterium]NIS28201.1 peptide ABC transporter ATP-binding protein [candidate division KSB1 bacterium]NIT75092.1 peptide ABC transporter ATP-binding protein [candidate division KSB1 bacterium]NIU28877.1 peptide ABC transporter ATP-binding protein [candidate division KSB1 bacterium]